MYFAHSARGSGWRTDLVLLNPHDKRVNADVEVYGTDGTHISRRLLLDRQGTTEHELAEIPGIPVETGGITVTSRGERLDGFLRFRYLNTALSIQASDAARAFMVPVSEAVDRVGVAVFNPSEDEIEVKFELDGDVELRTIAGHGKIAQFVDEIFAGARAEVLRISADEGKFAVLTLEQVGRSLVTLPATPTN